MQALAGSVPERAAAAIAAGCDIVLNCWAKMEDMVAIAGLLPAAGDGDGAAAGAGARRDLAVGASTGEQAGASSGVPAGGAAGGAAGGSAGTSPGLPAEERAALVAKRDALLALARGDA